MALGRNGVNLETLPVVQREQLQSHMPNGMVGEIRRHIGDADAPVCASGIGRRQGRQLAGLMQRFAMQGIDAIRRAQQQGRRHRHEQRAIGEIGQHAPFAHTLHVAIDDRQETAGPFLGFLEVAFLQAGLQLHVEGDQIFRLRRQHHFLGFAGALAVEALGGNSEIDPGLDHARIELDGLFVSDDRLLVAAHLAQCGAEREMSERVVGTYGDGPLRHFTGLGQTAGGPQQG